MAKKNKKPCWMSTTADEWLKRFYKELGEREESESYWIRRVLTDFAKKHKRNPENVDLDK